MKRAPIAVGAIGVVAIGVALWANRASNRAKEAQREAQARDGYAATAVSLAHSPDRKNAPAAALQALAIDHRLREPPDRDRAAIIGAAYAARRYGEHLVVESTGPLRDAAYRPDGGEVAIVGDEPMLRVVDLATGHVTATPLSEGAVAVAWTTADGLSVTTAHGTKRVLDTAAASDAGASAVAAPNTARALEDGRIRIFDARTNDRLEELDGHTGAITALKWSPDATGLVSTSLDRTATIWKLGARGLVRLLREVPEAPQKPQFPVTGDIGLVGAREIATYDDRTGDPSRRFTLASGTLATVGFYEQRVLGVTRDGDLTSWNAKTKERIGDAAVHASVVLARDAPVALACRDRECTVLDGDAHEIAKLPAPDGVAAQVISSNGKLAAFAGTNHAWTVVDVAAKAVRETTIPSDAPVPRALFANDHVLVAGATSVGLHDEAGKLLATLPGSLDELSDNAKVVRTLENGTARYFHTANAWKRGTIEVGAKLHALGPSGRVEAIVDGFVVSLRSTDQTTLTSLEGHTGAITAVSWSASGRYLVTTGEDRTLRVWDAGNGVAVAVIDVEETPATVQLSREGTRILTTDRSSRVVRLYDVSLDSAIAIACKVRDQTAASRACP